MKQSYWDRRASMISGLAESGLSMKEAAEKACLSLSTVRNYSKRFGIVFAGTDTLMLEAVSLCAKNGMTKAEAANELGISPLRAARVAKKIGVKFKHGNSVLWSSKKDDRAEAMFSMYSSGRTLQDIGSLYGITRERVRQIIKKHYGASHLSGGAFVSGNERKAKKKALLEEKFLREKGCTVEQYRSLQRINKQMISDGYTRDRTTIGAYSRQRLAAKYRGISFDLTIWQWWEIWSASGKWGERGQGKYVMCRFGDKGAYTLGNVYIASASHNSKLQPNNPYRKGHPDFKSKMAEKVASIYKNGSRKGKKHKYHDLPIGVTMSNGKYMAQIGVFGKKKYIGVFSDAESAHRAYLQALDAALNSIGDAA